MLTQSKLDAYVNQNTNKFQDIQPTERLLTTVKKRKLKYPGHLVRARNLCSEILEGRNNNWNRQRGRPRRRWTDDIKDWSNRTVAECTRIARDRSQRQKSVEIIDTSNGCRPSARKKTREEECFILYDASHVLSMLLPERRNELTYSLRTRRHDRTLAYHKFTTSHSTH